MFFLVKKSVTKRNVSVFWSGPSLSTNPQEGRTGVGRRPRRHFCSCDLWGRLTRVVRTTIVNRGRVRVWAPPLWLLWAQTVPWGAALPAEARNGQDASARCLLGLKPIGAPVL